MSERLPDGSWLLENNPLRGVKLPKEEDPRRPVATYDRFLKLREAAQDLAATAPQERGRDRWKRWEMALVLAEATGKDFDSVATYGRKGIVGERKQGEIGMQVIRAGDIVGDHTVLFGGMGERIEVTHRATSRDTFARGALRAAAWVVKQSPGLYDMQDVLGLK